MIETAANGETETQIVSAYLYLNEKQNQSSIYKSITEAQWTGELSSNSSHLSKSDTNQHCRSCSCNLTKTKADHEGKDYVAMDLSNVSGLYDSVSPDTFGSDDEELYRQVNVSPDLVDKSSSVPTTILMYLQR